MPPHAWMRCPRRTPLRASGCWCARHLSGCRSGTGVADGPDPRPKLRRQHRARLAREHSAAPALVRRTAPGFRALATGWCRRSGSFTQSIRCCPGFRGRNSAAREYAEAPPFLVDALLAAAKELSAEGEIVRLRSYKVVLKEDEEQARGSDRAGLRMGRAGSAVRAGGAGQSRDWRRRAPARFCRSCCASGPLVRVNEELVFHRAAIEGTAGYPGGAQIAALQRRHVQGMDRHFAQVCDSVARIPRPRTCDAPGPDRLVL